MRDTVIKEWNICRIKNLLPILAGEELKHQANTDDRDCDLTAMAVQVLLGIIFI